MPVCNHHISVWVRSAEGSTGATQLNTSLLTISVIAVLLPAAFHFANGSTTSDSSSILSVSHGVCVLSSIYMQIYLIDGSFQVAIVLLFSESEVSDVIIC